LGIDGAHKKIHRNVSAGEKIKVRNSALTLGYGATLVGARARFYNVIDLVNRLETEARATRQDCIADHLAWLDLVVLDELNYLPSAQSGGQFLFHLISRHYERT
jgi:DNA replication protein DnaC